MVTFNILIYLVYLHIYKTKPIIILLNIPHMSDKVGLLYFPLSSYRVKIILKKKSAKNEGSQNKCVYSALD